MLRKRKYKRYNETNDEDEGGRKFDIQEQIRSKRFDQDKERHLQELSGDEITLRSIQRHGFEKPILVKEPNGLDLRVPPKSFHVRDVRNSVGPQRIIDVMDVSTQKNIEMSMKDFCRYYESKHRDRLLNVISLEFSHTNLDELVEAPKIVKLLDWVDLVWPKFLKESQTESTNTINKMMYPKVQKYCLMSVKGSYTDFHIDFGGTSVWYHMIRGKKIFWMVPPTELNLQTFEEWTLSGMQQDVFFGDTVEECFRIELAAGNTFFIPSGWIHAVYTLEDSLVFGGNFLHSFGIENQLKVSKIEDVTRVPLKFRYPFYTEILWYVVQHYVYCLMGKDHLHRPAITVENTPEKQSVVGKKSCIQNDDDNEETDISTDSELNDGDTKKKAQSKKRKVVKRPTPSKKKSKKVSSSDDESTEIDSSNEAELKAIEKKSINTCRMTKNSLSRLQYEIEEETHQQKRQSQNSLPGDSKSENKGSKNLVSSAKKSNDQTYEQTKESDSKQQPSDGGSSTSNTLKLSDIILADSTKVNGWSANGNTGAQTTWSSLDQEPKEPIGIHLTKMELNGLKALVKHLSKLSGAKKNLPTLIKNSRALLDDCRKLIAEHENDDPELAITGIPITPEILHPKKSNINELIEQFFKPTDTNASTNASPISAKSIKSDSMTLTQQQRLKLSSSSEDKIPTSNTTASNQAPGSSSHLKASPQKETKCLSSAKKSSMVTTNSSSISMSTPPTTPPRPKSPPTRPLSNNQYTSKTKVDNNNLLLPGSFADLIAATSTEKKVFDVNSSEVTSSLFGIRELSSSKSGSTSPTKANTMKEKEKPNKLNIVQNKLPNPTNPVHNSNSNITIDQTKPAVQKPPISPEPPKTSLQKRFINPSFKPQVKEKLIFASAPYVSPVHVSDQSRTNNLYPWQSPAVPHKNQLNPQSSQQNYPTQQQHQHAKPSTAPPDSNHNKTTNIIQPPYKPPSTPTTRDPQSEIPNQTIKNVSHDQSMSEPYQVQSKSHDRPTTTAKPVHTSNILKNVSPITGSIDERRASVIRNDESKSISTKIFAPCKMGGDGSNAEAVITQVKTLNTDSSSDTLDKVIKGGLSDTLPAGQADSCDLTLTKQAKPRGPPKKSKEARQALDLDPQFQAPTSHAPTSVIIMNPIKPEAREAQVIVKPQGEIKIQNAAESSSSNSTKPKAKSTKRNKANSSAPNPSGSAVILNPAPQSIQAHSTRPPLLCGLVAPPINSAVGTSAGSSKINPQQYLISRPLLFNGAPAFSAAQMQQMTRSQLPMLATHVPTLGIANMQQNARIVWATQSPRPNTVGTSQSTASTSSLPSLTTNTILTSSLGPRYGVITAPRMRPPTTTPQPDNAALLSLATTALSTAPMSSSPTLSHLGVRSQPTQAIMVSSAASQPTLLHGQQIFNSFMQSMPMTHFAPAQPGAPRASGQLVFARLPPNTQGQPPRYLITQPGSLIHQRQQGPTLMTGQPRTTLAFPAYKPPAPLPVPDASKPMKSKKVKTS